MSKYKVSGVLLTVMALMLLGTSVYGDSLKKMPDFSLPSALDGETMKSEELKGKVLLITFFATWCPPCRKEIPTLVKLQKNFGPEGFSVIGMSVDEKGPKVVIKMIEKTKINYPVLMAKGKTARAFGGVVGIPTSFLVDREGNIVKRYTGYITEEELEGDLKSYL